MDHSRSLRHYPLLVLLLVLAIACSSSANSVAGKYVQENNPAGYLELKSDGTYFLDVDGRIQVAGKYEAEANQITLTNNMGFVSRLKLEGKTISGEGRRWTKQ